MSKLACLVVCLLTTAAPQQPDTPPAAEFRCLLAVSLDHHFEDRWYHTSGSEGAGIAAADSVVRKQYFFLYPFLTGIMGNAEGRARIEVDVRIAKPDGNTYFEQKGLEAADGLVGEPETVSLARELIAACFEPEDALGAYSIEMVARNVATGATATAKRTLRLVEYAEAKAFEDDAGLDAWADGYFDDPRPLAAIPALLYASRAGLESEKPRDMRGFLREVFDDNHWLFTELRPRFAKLTEPQRRSILWILARSSCDPGPFVDGLGASDRAAWAAILAEHRDPLEAPIAGREDLNELWGMYLATRRHAVLQRLCWALAPDETDVVAKTTVRVKGSETDVPIGLVVQEVVGNLLGAMTKSDKVTRRYLAWLGEQETTPAGVRQRIEAILD